ncbi:class I SAM-dependent methyltransferase [Mycobacterium sp. B14F4]|uniref:class I SAM-dependent methyltransferase n=1 Tax=Mycobacterium sp. B14F4 TaxID=3153565 RepID=UPI00325EFC36
MDRIDGSSLEGVSATSLWALHNRAVEANRPDAVIADELATQLAERIRYDYSKFGKSNQAFALRALLYDRVTTAYLRSHPRASVVALAEGLQTSFWRLDAAGVCDDVTWYSIDLPPVIAVRRQLLPRDPRVVELPQSALDRSWMDRVDASNGVIITAEGLFMYFEPEDVMSLIADCAKRFPGGQMLFDSIPHWLSRRTLRGVDLSDRYESPRMPFGFSADEGVSLGRQITGIKAAHDIRMPRGRGRYRFEYLPMLDRIPRYRRIRPSTTLLEFA